ncbi:MAG: monoamine oxidase, partial [Proteobacteria bacterium]|nr:monoamine oxidase [Pseudomonadota bacterium]
MARTTLLRKLILALQTARRENIEEQGLQPPLLRSDGWTRRRFVKTSAAAGMAGLAGELSAFPAMAKPASAKPDIAIVGAGLAGLNAAYQLKKAGITAQVYEARNRVGGRVLSSNAIGGGLIVDLGAELINTDHADMLELVKDFGIKLFDRHEDVAGIQVPREAFFFDGAPHGEADLARDLRAIAAQITKDADLIDSDWEKYAPALDRLSVVEYLNLHRDKIPANYVRELLETAIRVEYGAEPCESSALQLIFLLPVVDGKAVNLLGYSDETFAVVGGSAQITDALGAVLRDRISLGKVLRKIEDKHGKYRLCFADESRAEADIVILAMPFPVLNRVRLHVPLPRQLRRFIKEAELGSNEKLIARFTSRFWRQKGGFTEAAWSDLGFSEVWDETQRQTDRSDGALNFFLGGEQARELGKAQIAGEQFVKELDRFIPGAADAATGAFLKTGWTRSRFTLGGYANYKPGQLTRFGNLLWIESENPAERQQVCFKNMLFIGEHLSDAYYGFMNGAAQT